jgi:hypothetical protein
VRELAAKLENPLVAAVRRRQLTSRSRSLARRSIREFGGLDFFVHGAAFAPAAELSSPFGADLARRVPASRLDVSAYSLIALTRAVAPLMVKRGGGSVLTLTYLGSQRVFTNYNVMGVGEGGARVVGPVSRGRSRPRQHPRQRAVLGPIKTLAAAGISGFSSILQVYRERAPLRRNVDLPRSPSRDVPAEPGLARDHRRNRDGGRGFHISGAHSRRKRAGFWCWVRVLSGAWFGVRGTEISREPEPEPNQTEPRTEPNQNQPRTQHPEPLRWHAPSMLACS